MSSFNNEKETLSNQLNELKNQKENAHQRLEILEATKRKFNSLNTSVISEIDKLNTELSKSDRPLYCEEVDCMTEEDANIYSNIGTYHSYGYSTDWSATHGGSDSRTEFSTTSRIPPKQFKNKPYTGRIKKCQNGLVILISEYKDGLVQKIDEYDLNNGEIYKTTTYTEGKNPKISKVSPLNYFPNINYFEIPKVYVYEKQDDANSTISYEYIKIEKIESDLLRFTSYDANKKKISVSDERKVGEMFYLKEFSFKGIDGWVTAETIKNQQFCLDSNNNLKVDIQLLFTDGPFKVKHTMKNYGSEISNRSKMNVPYTIKEYIRNENGPEEEIIYYISVVYDKNIGIVGKSVSNEYFNGADVDFPVQFTSTLKRIIDVKEFDSMSPLIIDLN